VLIALFVAEHRRQPRRRSSFLVGKPGGNYSPGILTSGTLFISGQGGEDQMGKIPSDFEAEVKQCLDKTLGQFLVPGMSPATSSACRYI